MGIFFAPNPGIFLLQCAKLGYWPTVADTHPAVNIHSDKLMGWGAGEAKGKFFLLSYYPICSRGFDWISLPFGGSIGRIYPIVLLSCLFRESDRISFPFERGEGSPNGKFILLSNRLSKGVR